MTVDEEKAKPDADYFGYTDVQSAAIDVANEKRWAIHRQWFDESSDPTYCKRCGANVEPKNFDVHLQWHHRRMRRIQLIP